MTRSGTYYCARCNREHVRLVHAVPDKPISAWDALEAVGLAIVAAVGVYAVLALWLAS